MANGVSPGPTQRAICVGPLFSILFGVHQFPHTKSATGVYWGPLQYGASGEVTDRLSATPSLGFALGCDDNSVPDLTATVRLNYQIW